MHPPMMDKLAATRIDDMRRAAGRSRPRPGEKARIHPGATISRGIGITLIRVGRRLAGPDLRGEPRLLSPREAVGELHTLS
jgi:hypothetical protein